jgi:hypothetical protein
MVSNIIQIAGTTKKPIKNRPKELISPLLSHMAFPARVSSIKVQKTNRKKITETRKLTSVAVLESVEIPIRTNRIVVGKIKIKASYNGWKLANMPEYSPHP